MATPCTNDPNEVVEKVVSAEANADKFDTFVNGTDTQTVQLGTGEPTPTIRNAVRQVMADASWAKQYIANAPEGDVSLNNVRSLQSTTNRTLAERFADTVNILDYGVKNDGATDATAAIQAAIDANEGRTIRFPEGKYLISSPIRTSGDPAKAQMFVFDENAVLKASSSWTLGDFMVEYGVLDVSSAQLANGDSYGIVGGQFDTNGRASGIFYAGPQAGQFYNNRILNSKYIGMQVYDNDTYKGASDAWIENLFVHAPENIGANTQVSLILKATDNNIIGFRTFSGFCGVKIFLGGQYFKDAHVVGYSESFTDYEDTVGFDAYNANYECTFDACYSDNFSTGFYFKNQHHAMTNCECFWYSNGNHKHICIKANASNGVFLGRCDGLKVGFPVNGDNYVLYFPGQNLSNYNYDTGPASGRITNTILKEVHSARLKHPFSDMAFLSCFSGSAEQSSNDRNAAVAGKWYPVASFSVSSYVGGGFTFVTICNENLFIDLHLSLNATTGWAINGGKLYQSNGASIVIGMGALGDCFQDNGGTLQTSMMLYLKYTNVGNGSKTGFRVKLHENDCISMYSWPRNICSSGTIQNMYALDSIPNQIGNTVNFAGHWVPFTDNLVQLGAGSMRFKEVFAAAGTINTSDAREKTSVESPSDALFRAWGKLRYKMFQFVDAVAEKGTDKARMHIGLIAQDVDAAFTSEGLNAERFGLFCHDEWEAEYTTDTVVDTPAQYNEKGEMVSEAQTHVETRLVRPAGDRYGIRYEEALALESAYQRWRLEQLEARLNEISGNGLAPSGASPDNL